MAPLSSSSPAPRTLAVLVVVTTTATDQALAAAAREPLPGPECAVTALVADVLHDGLPLLSVEDVSTTVL